MDPSVQSLLDDLKSPDEERRDRATQALWHRWFHQKGMTGLEQLQRAQYLMDVDDFPAAEAVLTELIAAQPDFSEAWNRRAVLRYTQKRYKQAIMDCKTVLRLVPYHFGALHGMGLCYAAVGQYRDAIRIFHRALEVQPHVTINRVLLLECTTRLD